MRSFFAVSFAALAIGNLHGAAAQVRQLKAGAAKVDVTPAPSELPKNYEGIFDTYTPGPLSWRAAAPALR